MVDTAGTICEAVRTLNESGAKSVTLVATHGLLSGPAVERLSHCGAHEIVFMDTVPIPEEKRLPNMTVLSCAPLLAAVFAPCSRKVPWRFCSTACPRTCVRAISMRD